MRQGTPRREQVGIYVRISQDRTGAGLGVERQEDDCRALCERRGWTVADTYVDNDMSATSGRPRPEWQRLLGDVEAGAIGGIAVWHIDRLTRRPAELENVITLAERHGLTLGTVTGDVDLGTPTGKLVARILGAAARNETETKMSRQRREREQAAKAGKVHTGGARAYGFKTDRVTVAEAEADIIRECAQRVLAGESLGSVCRDLEARDVRTPITLRKTKDGQPIPNGHWQARTLRRLLASARISGRREHLPRDSYPGNTRPIVGEITAKKAVWPAIISPADSDRLRKLLSNPDRNKNTGTRRSYLLTSVLYCGRCGQSMVGRPREGVPRYICMNIPGSRRCGRMVAGCATTDEYVRDLVLVALEDPALRDRLTQQRDADPALVESAERDQRKLIELAEAWAEDALPIGEWKAARGIVEERLARTERRIARMSGPDPLSGFVGTFDEMRQRWDEKNVSQRRAVVAAVLEKVIVNPADTSIRWDRDRFEPVWRA